MCFFRENDMKKINAYCIAIALACMMAVSSSARIIGFESMQIEFTEGFDIADQATWPEKLKEGARENGPFSYVWFQTKPLALGRSWRAPSAVSIDAAINTITPKQNDDSPTARLPSELYVRYSPDMKNWSCWQVFSRGEREVDISNDRENHKQNYSVRLKVSRSERQQYKKLLWDYALRDVPWKSDEEAAVRWILKEHPDFFSQNLPFIGYVEFRYESQSPDPEQINSFSAEVGYGMGGAHSRPRDKGVYDKRRGRPWLFKATEVLPDLQSDTEKPQGPSEDKNTGNGTTFVFPHLQRDER